MELDETYRRIVAALLDNGRLSYRQIAKKANVSVATVMHRINRLEKEKVITGYSVSLDLEKLGYDVSVIVSIKVSKGRLFEVERKIASNPNVSAVFDVTGDFDVVLIARFKNRRSLDSFLKNLQMLDFVESTHTILVLNIIKDRQIIPQ